MKTTGELVDIILKGVIVNRNIGAIEIQNLLKEWAFSIIDECALVCMTDDAIKEDIERVKKQIV